MLKKTITYKNLDDVEVTEDFYFHFSKAELAEMALEDEELEGKLKVIAEGNDKAAIIRTFKMIIEKTVGRRSEDGKRFIKDPEFAADFMQSEAFSELFMQLFTNAEVAAQFIVGVVPSDLSDMLQEKVPGLMKDREITGITDVQLPEEKEYTFDDFSDEELLKMSDENFDKMYKKLKGGNIPKRVLILARRRQQD